MVTPSTAVHDRAVFDLNILQVLPYIIMPATKNRTIFITMLLKPLVLMVYKGISGILYLLHLNFREDQYWVKEAEKRLATWDDSKALTHEEVWGLK